MAEITAERVQELLEYDPLTGWLTWRLAGRGRARKGALAGTKNKAGYLVTCIDRHFRRNHRLAWVLTYGVWPTHDIDHLNGVRDDNRIANLRDVPRATNLQNQRVAQPHNKVGLLGVSWRPDRGKFQASIKVGDKSRYIGYFVTPEDAHRAYVATKRRIHDGCTI